ncbi:uroporphyrinogen-III C-methyltransferase [Nitrincola tapanii]|uniref:Heme biosynthesis protein n=1 Tax=Nitrincola tapanii TaxID=1708751 RepID=A0A5A9W6Y5_9GAMM|nr:uroporphyrinogen-III C-methyltransferase [Nitrincola tapanii]KAA0876204.1 heme biosynthesis protein [Nitrincola tapanii]
MKETPEEQRTDANDIANAEQPSTTSADATHDPSKEPEIQPDSAQASDANPQTSQQKSEPNSSAAIAATQGHWSGKTALVLSLAALGLSGYLFWQAQQVSQQQALVAAQIEARLAEAQAEVANTVSGVNQQLGQLQERASSGQRNLDELHERLTRSIQQVTAQQQISEKDWLLAESEYLLRLANQRVLMEQTSAGALSLLKATDELLLEADDVALYPVRQALAQDIAALEAVPQVDVEGLFLRISALRQQVPNLRMTPVTDRRQLPDLLESITPEDLKETWGAGAKAAMNRALDTLGQLIIIQHRDEPVEPLLSPEQSYYLQQNLFLMLEQAQQALLQRQQGAFRDTLGKASEWIAIYYESTDSTTQALLRSLDELKALEIAPELPSIAGSLEALKSHMNELRRLKREGGSQ